MRASDLLLISDANDPRLAELRDLQARRDQGPRSATVVVEGAIAVARALASDATVDVVVGTSAQLLRLGRLRMPEAVFAVEPSLLAQLVGFPFHRGVLAVVQRPAHRPVDLDARLQGRWTAVVLERIADPVNVGAVIRTATALGVDLVVCGGSADPYCRRALRASMGHALVRMPWIVDRLDEAVDELVTRGGQVVAATTSTDAVDVASFNRTGSVVVLFGNEGAGLSPALRARGRCEVTIPIAAGSDSLNVAAAAAIVLHALR